MATACIRSKEAKPRASVHHQQRLLRRALQYLDVFLEKIMSKVLNCKNGLADRILTLYGQHDSISLDETAHMLIIFTNRQSKT